MASIDVRRIFDSAVQAQYGEDGARYFASTAWTALRDQLTENPNLVMSKTKFWLRLRNWVYPRQTTTARARLLLLEARLQSPN